MTRVLNRKGGPTGDDNYWLYPTQSDTEPTAEAPPGGANSANYIGGPGTVTDVGAYDNYKPVRFELSTR